jgi:hypothetical protein
LLIDGISYPGVQVTGPLYSQNTGFDVGNFDINPWDNISYGPEGRPTYDPAILDAVYESEYLDPYLGTRPTDINVDGGAYVDTFSSHAPQELVPGSEFDTLDLRVYTTPGADWANNGHGFAETDYSYQFDSLTPTLSFQSTLTILPYPVALVLTNQTQTHIMILGVDYTIDWVNNTVTVLGPGANTSDILQLTVYGLGGGNQLYRNRYNGAAIGNSLIIPVAFSAIQEIAVFVNGVITTAFAYSALDTIRTQITFTTTYTATDNVVVVPIGVTTINDTPVAYSWSTPQTQVIAATTGVLTYTLTNSLEYANPDNLYVTVNGVRARTSAGIEYYGDGSSEYLVPDRLGVSQSLIADNQVHVYLDDVPQQLNVDFVVEPYDINNGHDGRRQILFINEPSIGERILICVDTNTQCTIVNGNQLQFNTVTGLIPSTGDTISVTTWNDTRQQDVLTKVYVGPITAGITVTENYDETEFDLGDITGAAGSYDYGAGITVSVNDLQLQRVITDPTRLWVTLNGDRLLYGNGYTLSGEELILSSGVIGVTDVVMITEFTNSVAPDAMAFRIFQDMRGVQATYRITPSTTTTLSQALDATDNIIHITNAAALDNPNIADNIWGVLTVNGERIMYRERDTVNNTVSSLLRGTAGTAVAAHTVDSLVYEMGRANILPAADQNYIVNTTVLADGTTVLFVAENIDITTLDSTTVEEAVEVYVGGIRVTTGYIITGDSPVTIVFTTAPVSGSEVTILVRRGVTWYQGTGLTPSDGVALQDTQTAAARFLRGLS